MKIILSILILFVAMTFAPSLVFGSSDDSVVISESVPSGFAYQTDNTCHVPYRLSKRYIKPDKNTNPQRYFECLVGNGFQSGQNQHVNTEIVYTNVLYQCYNRHFYLLRAPPMCLSELF